MDYKTIRDKRRKRVSITVDIYGNVLVKAGLKTSKEFIEKFVNDNIKWIQNRREIVLQRKPFIINPTQEQISDMKKEALNYMTNLTIKYAQIMELKPTNIKITSAKKRWGSCSGKNSICYTYNVMMLPEKCREYIVVHELAHIKEKNHSSKFYKIIEKYMPEYRSVEKELAKYSIA